MGVQRILIIASHSTEKTAPRGIQAGRLIRELSKHYSIDLITSTYSALEDGTTQEKLGVDTLTFIQKAKPTLLRKSLRLISNFFGIIDAQWTKRASQVASEMLRCNDYGAVLILSMPLYNANTIFQLKKAFPSQRFTGFFSDPISLNPYLSENALVKRLLRNYEFKLFKNFSAIIFPSMKMVEAYANMYPNFHFRCIPHSWEGEVNPKDIDENHDNVIRYIGSLNNHRSPEILIEWLNVNQLFFKERDVRFEFVGPVSRRLKFRLYQLNLSPSLIKFIGPVTYEDSVALTRRSLALLIIDAGFPASPFLPSKLVETLPFGRPLIGISPEDSETSRVLELTGNYTVNMNNMENLKYYVDIILGRKRSDNKRVDNQGIASFNVVHVVKKWGEVIDGDS